MKNYMITAVFGLLLSNIAFAIEKSSINRPDRGEKITQAEKIIATNEFITLLKDTQYFDFISTRIHGQTETEKSDKYWWGNMWTGVVVTKSNGEVTFTHQNNGSDNVGIHTAPYLEGACYAYMLTGDKKLEYLTRRLMRGFSAWILSSQNTDKSNGNELVNVLSRSFYPDSFKTEVNGTPLKINYDATHPGINNGVAEFVHVKNNIFGDVWVKNNRSIDDIGHMIRAMAQVQACRPFFGEEAVKDLDQMNDLYSAWAKSVVDSNFIIPTLDSNSIRFIPHKGLGDYNFYNLGVFDPNCTGKFAVSLLYDKNATNFHCGEGVSLLEKLFRNQLQNDPVEIQRSHHVAAVAMADLNSLTDISVKLRMGLAKRMDHDFKLTKNPAKFPKLDVQDVPTFLIHANNVGVPLTSDEIRFVYERLHLAFTEMRSKAHFNTIHLFESIVPDGKYSFDPPNQGLYFYTIGAMLGSCNSALLTKSDRTLFNCEKIKEALQK